METKRKASANGTEGADTDRAAKRRKLVEEYGDLTDGETTESTTAYGLNILESIRATTDKNGRSVSPYFESLPSPSANPQYYKKIRLPLSLEIIEVKLQERQYPTLSSLESDFKRLVSNAKETNERNSTIFGDAERVRKAVSNLMVKHNPAYKTGSYQAVPTPLPPTPEPEGEEEDGEVDAEGDEAADEQATGEDGTVDAEDAEAKEEELEEDGEGEEEEDDGGQEDEDEQEDEESNKRYQQRRRRGSSRKKADYSPALDSPTAGQAANSRAAKGDHYYEGVPFAGLNFQQAQEKIVEELIRKEDPDNYTYFDPFIFLPPRILKDYYEVIAEPLSLRKLQKQVRGQHGRGEATYVSDFKGWAAFEDQASLIWKNAYHYNEDGSDIFILAQELEETFHELLKEAKAGVPEPPQPKIKLKVPQAAEASGHPKKITIHVGGKTSVAGSPAPVTGQSGETEATRNDTPVNRNPFSSVSSAGTPANLGQLGKARSTSASAGPPSPSVRTVAKTEDAVPPAPVARPQAPTTTFHHFVPAVMNPQVPGPLSNGTAAPQYQQPAPQAPPPPPPVPKRSASDILEAQKYRPRPIKETEALMPRVVIATHPALQLENKLVTIIPASVTEYQQSIVMNTPLNHFRLELKPQIASFLELQQREWKLNVILDTTRLFPSAASPLDKRGEPVFDVNLHFGVNRLEVCLVAALPRGEKAPNGLNMEMERVVLHVNLLKH
ncbi:Bromodomain-containing protein [Nemania sp. FL0916]|nr:Bromodomain-containing protein [Nemania sp. FL0916]